MVEFKEKSFKDLNIKKDSELDCYIRIIDYFENKKENRERTELWKCQFMMKLMKEALYSDNKILVKNALIIMISLFENIPADMYISRGTDASQLSSEDRKKIMRLLKNELFPI